MLIKVIDAEYIRGYQIALTFNDGTHKVVDLKDSLNDSVFKPLKKLENFKNFKLNRWTIEWENGADMAPAYLHELAKAQPKEEKDLS